MMKIVLYGAIGQKGFDILADRFVDRATVESCAPGDPAEQLAACLGDAHVFISSSFDRSMPEMENLRLLQLPMSGYDDVEIDAVPPGAVICNVYEHETGIAEFVFAALLDHVVHLRASHDLFRTGDWRESPRLGAGTRGELAGKRLLSVGYGNIGRAVGRRARAFGMDLDAVTRTVRPLEPAPDRLAGYDGLMELLPDADYVLICCPLTDDTESLIDARALGAMKKNAVIINVARGPIIDQQALYDALTGGQIAGAVIDTWYNYPSVATPRTAPADLPLDQLDNIVITPHLSGWTDGQQRRRWQRIGDNIENLLSGRPLDNVLRQAEG